MVYTISIGSNDHPTESLALAHKRLQEQFPGIRFTATERTAPLGMGRGCPPFANQVARFCSTSTPAEVRARLKAIEREAGRRPDGGEEVRLDLDLLTCDDLVLKPGDLERDFIARAIASLT